MDSPGYRQVQVADFCDYGKNVKFIKGENLFTGWVTVTFSGNTMHPGV